MYDNYNYPMGADTPDAPWNQSDPDDMEFEVSCTQTLSRIDTVVTNNYIPGASGVDYESDDEGGYVAYGWKDDPDTSNTDWGDEWENNDLHTPLQLIDMLKDYVQKEADKYLIDHKDDHLDGKTCRAEKQWRYKRLLKIIDECETWEEVEIEYEKA